MEEKGSMREFERSRGTRFPQRGDFTNLNAPEARVNRHRHADVLALESATAERHEGDCP